MAEWVRMKCLYGCPEYGQQRRLPAQRPSGRRRAPASSGSTRGPPSSISPRPSSEPEDRHAWSRKHQPGASSSSSTEVFKAGFVKAFLLFIDSCGICLDCAEDRGGLQGAQALAAVARRHGHGRLRHGPQADRLPHRGPVRLRPGDEPLRLPARRLGSAGRETEGAPTCGGTARSRGLSAAGCGRRPAAWAACSPPSATRAGSSARSATVPHGRARPSTATSPSTPTTSSISTGSSPSSRPRRAPSSSRSATRSWRCTRAARSPSAAATTSPR
ncbi:MAG: DUF2284 domain-containing protein [Ignavibacteriales bacterium]|nr:DUF2284 domain-containing protein [Ignavibacteriales bacterium]